MVENLKLETAGRNSITFPPSMVHSLTWKWGRKDGSSIRSVQYGLTDKLHIYSTIHLAGLQLLRGFWVTFRCLFVAERAYSSAYAVVRTLSVGRVDNACLFPRRLR